MRTVGLRVVLFTGLLVGVGPTIVFGLPGVGTGVDGVLTVTGSNLVDSVKTKLTTNAVPGATVIRVASEAGFGAGSEVLILCLQGPGAGTNEFATVASAAAGTLTLNAPLQNSYDVAGGARVLVQRVPHYLDVTVKSNGVLTASAWVGGASSWTPGGVVAFRVKRAFMIGAGGRVTADALGFAGGAGVSSGASANGYQGESYTLAAGAQSREPNAGAGGAGLYYSTTGDAAGGGGGGGHATAGSPGATAEPYHGLGGGAYGSSNMTALLLGSGGGAGGTDDDADGSSKGGDGGRGGGIVFIAAPSMMIEGALSAAGGNGQTVADTDGDGGDESGGGGGGAGGTVVLASAAPPSQTVATLVPGGSGGGVESGAMLGGGGGLGVFAYVYVNPGLWSDADYRDTSFTLGRSVISNAAQLAQFAWLVNTGETYLGRTLSLVGDIDLAAHDWVPAGSGFTMRFEGVFDGAGRLVRNLRIDQPTADYQGLLGCVGGDGAVRNLSLTNVAINGHDYVGGVAGRSFGTLSNCVVLAGGAVTGTSYSVGGVVGCAEGALLACANGVGVTGAGGVGGVAGEANGTTANCRNSGPVQSTGSSVGGVAGIARGTLTDCFNSGAVAADASESTGGIAGSSEGDMDRCTNDGSVAGYFAAGLVGSQGYGRQLVACVNAGAITGTKAAGIVVSAAGLVQNCANSGQVIGLHAGGIAENLWNGAVRNCRNSGEVGGFSSAGGLVRALDEGTLLENSANCGPVRATDNKAGGLAYRNRGSVTNGYWKLTGVEPFNVPAVWTNYATVAACESFGEAPGTLAAPVTVGGVTADRLSAVLNAGVSAAWTPGCGLYRWTAGSATDYPALAPAIEVGGAVIPQTLSDGFMAGIDPAQIAPVVARYTGAHPGATASSFGSLLSDADALGFTFAELSAGDALLDFSPSLTTIGFDRATRTLTFSVANGIDPTATAAMNRLAASEAGLLRVLQSVQPGGGSVPLPPVVTFRGDGTAEATYTLPESPDAAFFRLSLEHRP